MSERAARFAAHLHGLLGRLAEIAGGRLDTELLVSSDDENGGIEHMIDEVVRNARFAHQALRKQLRIEEESHLKAALIAAQRELLQQLSTPAAVAQRELVSAIDYARAQLGLAITERVKARPSPSAGRP